MATKVLVLGVTGMLGSVVFKELSKNDELVVLGTKRSEGRLDFFTDDQNNNLISGIDVLESDSLVRVLDQVRPEIVINCIGLIKQFSIANNPLIALPINSMFPHRLSKLCSLVNSRLIHISTDCVFNGRKGMYRENDISDAEDLYGKSKFIGELHDESHAVTIRTSIIGHELNSSASLVDWFLSQSGHVKGYTKAIFSGLPTVELARVIMEYVIPNADLKGLYHVSVDPIDKYSLLNQIAKVYSKDIEIIPDENVQIDRSLESSKFKQATGYVVPSWEELITKMYNVQ